MRPAERRIGRRARRHRTRRQRRALHRRMDPVVEVDAVVGRRRPARSGSGRRDTAQTCAAGSPAAESRLGRRRARPSAPAYRGDPCTGSYGHRAPRSASPAAVCSTTRPGCRSTVSSPGLRHCDGGRNPTVHGGGSLMVSAKSPSGRPVGLILRQPERLLCRDDTAGSITSNCSSDGL